MVFSNSGSFCQHEQHLLGVVLPVGGQMNVAARDKTRDEELYKPRLDQPALVMALLRPRVGEKNVNPREALGPNHLLHHIDSIVLDDADVGELLLFDQLEQAAHTGRMHFDAEIVVVRISLCDRRGRFAHSAPDLQDRRSHAAEGHVEIERLR